MSKKTERWHIKLNWGGGFWGLIFGGMGGPQEVREIKEMAKSAGVEIEGEITRTGKYSVSFYALGHPNELKKFEEELDHMPLSDGAHVTKVG